MPPIIVFHWRINPTIKYNTNIIITATIMNKRSFTIPIFEISPTASPIANALVKSSVLANLHCPMNNTNAKMTDMMKTIMVDNQFWKMTAKIAEIMIGIII